MSRHEGVSCDSCLKGNFRGRRYKCLICYDYDLCATCYEAGATTTRHTIEHPMQCILTHSDSDLYYGGESLSLDQPQSFTCPYCGKMGYTEVTLQEHVTADHADSTNEVVCPICASQPGGEPNLITDDFTNHLVVEHRNSQRDLITFLDEPATRSRHVRRIPHPTASRGAGRRTNMHFSTSAAMSSLSPTANRDSVDPIAELLSQLSGVRRTAAQGSASAQLQHLQMQLQLERQQSARQQLERLPRRQGQTTVSAAANGHPNAAYIVTSGSAGTTVTSAPGGGAIRAATLPSSSGIDNVTTHQSNIHNQPNPQLILSKIFDSALPESDLQLLEVDRADRSVFMKEILLTTMKDNKEETRSKESISSSISKLIQQQTATPPIAATVSPPITTVAQPSSSFCSPSGSAAAAYVASEESVSASDSAAVDSDGESTTYISSAAINPYLSTRTAMLSSLLHQRPQDFITTTTTITSTTTVSGNVAISSSSIPTTINAAASSSTMTTISPTSTTDVTTTTTATAASGTVHRSTSSRGAANGLNPSSPGISNSIGNNIRDMIVVGSTTTTSNNNYNADASRRKPLCPIDTTALNQTTEPPTSH